MLNVGVRLDRIICNVEPESSAEPYLWTSFFHADLSTWFRPGSWIATHTPHANWTTRGVFPDGIGAGDSVDIPPSLGAYDVVLNPSIYNIAAVGTLFVLMEQDHTPGYAIRAGHEAFAEAVHSVLNAYVAPYVDELPPTIPEPTDAEIQQLASQIQGEVEGAIKDELSAVHLLYDHDVYYGFGYLLLTDLPAIAVGGVSTTRRFSSRITGQLVSLSWLLPYDYEIELHVTCEPDEHLPDNCVPEYEVYGEAAAEVRRLDLEILRIRKELRSAPNDARVPLKRELRELWTTRRPAAVDLLDSAHEAHRLCCEVAASPAAQDQKQLKMARAARLARSAHGQIPVEATVTSATPL